MTEEQVSGAAPATGGGEKQTAPLPPLTISASDGKPEIRTKVWDYLADNKLAAFPWPPHKRIPNFKSSDEAGDKVKTLEMFEKATVLKVDPDKPLQQIRIHALNEKKSLLVPTPRLRYGFLNKITPPEGTDKRTIKACATRQGFAQYSAPTGIEDNLRVDLVIVGSVAISRKGWRVGKGEGFSDLEYGIMAALGLVDAKTPVIAVVHDCQIVDLPDNIFCPHDVPVDFIVTPTQVINCVNRPAKPAGIIWSLLTAEKLTEIPILRKLRYRDWKSGKDVKLSGETENPAALEDEELIMEDPDERKSKPRQFRRGTFRGRRRGRRTTGGQDSDGGDDGKENRRSSTNRDQDDDRDAANDGAPGFRRRFRGGYRGGWGRRGRGGRRGGGRMPPRRNDDDGDYDHGEISKEGRGGGRGGRSFRGGRRFGRRYMGDFEGSVYVGSLPRSLRVSDFKGEVRERKVNPLRVMWRGSSGFAFLNFKTRSEAEEALVALEGLHFNDRSPRLEMAKEREQRNSGGGGRRRRTRRDSRSGDDEDEEQEN